MDASVLRTPLTLLLLVLAAFTISALAAEHTAGERSERLLSIATPGADALDVQASIKPEGDSYRRGVHCAITVVVDEPAYLLALLLAADGSCRILFPPRVALKDGVPPRKRYDLFETDSSLQLRLGKPVALSQVLLFLSSRRPPYECLPEREGLVAAINPDDTQGFGNLVTVVREMAGGSSFQRLAVSVPANDGKMRNLSVSQASDEQPGTPRRRMLKKALPGGTKSRRPESVTGVQGIKDPGPEPVGD